MLRQTTPVVLLVLAVCHVIVPANCSARKDNVLIKGDILLGALVPVHSKDADLQCGAIHERLGVQRLEALLYAFDQINANSSISLGLEVYDTCSSETTALDKALNFINSYLPKGSSTSVATPHLAGVIGAAYSSVSIQIAHLLRLFKIPQISYDSTSYELSDKKRFEYFSRTVPHDNFQAKAIVDVLRHFNWTYVSVVYSDDSYGTLGMEALRHAASHAGICMATTNKVKASDSVTAYLAIMDAIIAEPLARTVIVFASQERQIKGLLEAAQTRNTAEKLQFVGSDAWGNVVWRTNLQKVAVNAITVSPKSVKLKGFQKYFTDLNPTNNERNPWFKEYWQYHFNCSLNNTLGVFPVKCNNSLELTPENSDLDMRSASAIDAVSVFAHALNAMHADLCRSVVGLCSAMDNISGPVLLKYIRNISFVGATGERVRFNDQGDVQGVYDILAFTHTGNGIHKNTVIGTWANGLQMGQHGRARQLREIKSTCSAQCKNDEVKVAVKGKESCCWTCQPCRGNSYVVNTTTCNRCPLGFWPKKNIHGCYKIPVDYFGKNLRLALPAIGFSGLGIFLTLFVIYLLAKNDKTPIVKACGREMAYLLLVSILLCFANTFFIIVKPSNIMCTVRFFGSSLAFTIGYAAIFIKTNRISRIFNRRNIAKRPVLVLPSSQLILVLGVVIVQAILLVLLTLLRAPTAKLYYPTVSTVYLGCSTSDLDFGLSQVYNFILIVMCTIYAFKTRKIPSNFNEAKLIAFAMYSSCVIWLAFLAVYFMQTSFLIRPLIVCVSVSLVAYVLLGGLYAPKVYILLFRPHRNVRRRNNASLSLSSINHSNPKCQKCAGYVGVNHSVEGDGDRQISDNIFDGNRLSLMDYNRPESYANSQDGPNRVDVEKYLTHLRKELQGTKLALKVANEKLRKQDKELAVCEEKQPLHTKSDPDSDETNGDSTRAMDGDTPKTVVCEVTNHTETKEAAKNGDINTTAKPMRDEVAKIENSKVKLRPDRKTPLGKAECQLCILRRIYGNDDITQKMVHKSMKYNALDSAHAQFNGGHQCEHESSRFPFDEIIPRGHKGTLSLWRRSRSLSDIENKLNSVLALTRKVPRMSSLASALDIGSKEDHKHSYRAIPDLDESFMELKANAKQKKCTQI